MEIGSKISPLAGFDSASAGMENASLLNTNTLNSKVLNKDDFLQLLMTQMQHQDPTQPMDTNQMMAQLAQLSTVQQLDAMSANFASAFRTEQMALARDLIGSTVRYYSNGALHTGVAEEAAVENDRIGVTVNETFVPLDNIRGISAAAAAAADAVE